MVGERKASLLSGTFHYWRVHPESWPIVLHSIQEMGLETIETYIPWQYHELKPGRYDFTGQTDSRRDLAGFLKPGEGFRSVADHPPRTLHLFRVGQHGRAR